MLNGNMLRKYHGLYNTQLVEKAKFARVQIRQSRQRSCQTLANNLPTGEDSNHNDSFNVIYLSGLKGRHIHILLLSYLSSLQH